jgi:uncharacterized membrane protein (DUF2068 family)
LPAVGDRQVQSVSGPPVSSDLPSADRDRTGTDGDSRERSRLLPWIAAERAIGAIILVSVGVIFVTHQSTNWGQDIAHLARHLGFDPSSNGIQSLVGQARKVTPSQLRLYGIAAICFGLVEGAEGYGLFRQQRWAEYLTVVVTALLFIPEIDELVKKPSILKLVLFILNVAVVTYLVVRLRRNRPHD